jgi:hypothetical protein
LLLSDTSSLLIKYDIILQYNLKGFLCTSFAGREFVEHHATHLRSKGVSTDIVKQSIFELRKKPYKGSQPTVLLKTRYRAGQATGTD